MGMGCLHQRLGRTRALPFVRRFKPSEIEAATSGFSTALETGGPRGTAYRARFADGLVATVRRAGGGDPEQEGQEGAFYRELQLLGRLNHRHVVRLRGFSEGHNRFLVFDQMENRSLKECLHDPLRTPLNWRTRLQVAIDVAAALEYLYYFCDPPVFHVTVNSSNVMMDADFVAKLSDVSVVGHDASEGSHAEGSLGHFYHHFVWHVWNGFDTDTRACVFFLQSEFSRGGRSWCSSTACCSWSS
uniref:Protein kinase domain-containing protein n=1 Tax=Aegilops tauschii subsp. strangulata TaxID=200361 RepID=A0A453BMB3_AEGTS